MESLKGGFFDFNIFLGETILINFLNRKRSFMEFYETYNI